MQTDLLDPKTRPRPARLWHSVIAFVMRMSQQVSAKWVSDQSQPTVGPLVARLSGGAAKLCPALAEQRLAAGAGESLPPRNTQFLESNLGPLVCHSHGSPNRSCCMFCRKELSRSHVLFVDCKPYEAGRPSKIRLSRVVPASPHLFFEW